MLQQNNLLPSKNTKNPPGSGRDIRGSKPRTLQVQKFPENFSQRKNYRFLENDMFFFAEIAQFGSSNIWGSRKCQTLQFCLYLSLHFDAFLFLPCNFWWGLALSAPHSLDSDKWRTPQGRRLPQQLGSWILSIHCESLSTPWGPKRNSPTMWISIYIYIYIEMVFLAVSLLILNVALVFGSGWVFQPNLHTPPAAQQVFQPPWSIPQKHILKIKKSNPTKPTISLIPNHNPNLNPTGSWAWAQRSSIPFQLKIACQNINIKIASTSKWSQHIHHVIHKFALQWCYLKNPTTYTPEI